jgi:hypothetical protein
MKRVLIVVPILAAAVLATAGCAKTGPLETKYEVTGEASATAQMAILYNSGDAGTSTPTQLPAEKGTLPWTTTLVAGRGDTVLTATPSKGALTCRIVVEGKEVAKVAGQPGQAVTCKAPVDQ